MKALIPLFFFLLILNGASAQKQPPVIENKDFCFKIISSPNQTWGYDIYYNNRLFIHQPSIPALPGNNGFATKEAAEKVAKKVIEKINNGENPPGISIDELHQLGALRKQ